MRRPLFGVLAGIAAAVWITILLFPWDPPDYEQYRNNRILVTGTVCGLEPKRTGNGGEEIIWRMTLCDVEVGQGGQTGQTGGTGKTGVHQSEDSVNPQSENAGSSQTGSTGELPKEISIGKRARVLCVLDREPALEMSARVRVSGTLQPFRPAYNEGEFDLRLYNHILRTEFSLRDVNIIAASVTTNPVAAALYHFKKRISNVIDRNFSTRNSAVLQAMLLGEKGLLEEETKELFQGAGIIHILSISGLHLSLLGMGLFSLLGKCRVPLPVRAGVSVLVLVLYGEMVGMGTSAFRAVVMLSLYIVARVIGRTYDLMTASAIACILLLLDQPLYLLHTGFQFSFAAVLSMGILVPALPDRSRAGDRLNRLQGTRGRLSVRQIKSVRALALRRLLPDGILRALAIPLGTLPVYLWAYGTFPAWSLLLNLLVIPLMLVVMVSAGSAALVGTILSYLGIDMIGAGIAGSVGLRDAGLPFLRTVTAWSGTREAAGYAGAGVNTGISTGAGMPPGHTELIARLLLRLVSFPAEFLLDLFRFLAEKSEKLPGHALILGRPSPAQTVVYYGMLFLFSAISVRLQMPGTRRRVENASSIIGGKAGELHSFEGTYGNRPYENRPYGNRSYGNGSYRSGLYRQMLKFLIGIGNLPVRAAQAVCLRLGLYDNRARRRFGTLCAAAWCLLSVLVLTARNPPAFEMDFLYVGQGDGICIRCGTRTFLVDGGSTTNEELGKYTLRPFLYSKGIRKLDGLILTHDDLDHCSGMLDLLAEAAEGTSSISIGAVYLPDIGQDARGEHYRELERLAEQAGIQVLYLHRGQRIRIGDRPVAEAGGGGSGDMTSGETGDMAGTLTLDCLHPAQGAEYEEPNAYSTTLLLRYQGFSALLTGDLDGQGEEDLVKYLAKPGVMENVDGDGILHPTVLKVAHHGSRYATQEAFLERVKPQYAIISAGRNNMYGHPHREVLERLRTASPLLAIYRTDLQGEITIWQKKRGDFQVKGFLGGVAEILDSS